MTSRMRSKDLEPEYINFEFVDDAGTIVYQDEQCSLMGHSEMADIVTPGFHGRIAEGEIINNPMTYTSSTRYNSDEPGRLEQVNNIGPPDKLVSRIGNVTLQFLDNAYMPWIGNPLDPIPGGNLADVARQKCLAFIDRTPVALAEDLGEIRETVQFLKHPIQSIERLVRTFVGDKKSLSKIKNSYERAQAMADLWKTYRFAVGPLMRSVVDVLELAAHKPPNRPKRRRSSGRSKESSKSDSPKVYRATPSYMSQVYEYHALGYRELNYHATVLYEVENPLVDWKYKLGLRLKDLPTTGWELIPLSFMVDRMLDIRSFFAGTINLIDPNVTILAGSVTERNLSQYTYSLVDTEYAGVTRTIPVKDFVQWEDFSMNRSVWVPNFFDTIPSFTPRGLVKDLTSILDLLTIVLGFLPQVNPDF